MSDEQSYDAQNGQDGQQMQQSTGGGGETHHNTGTDDDRKIFVGGLNWETTTAELTEYMTQFGKVENCTLKTDPETRKSRGFGFVVFEDVGSLEKVFAQKEHTLHGKKIDPKRANPKGDPYAKKIYVNNVNPSIGEEEIKEYFEKWGKVEKVETPKDKIKDERKSFVFVEFESEQTVKRILEDTESKHKLGNEELEIKKATPSSRGGFRFNRGGGFGYNRGPGNGGRGGRGGRGGYGYGGDHWGNQQWGSQGYGGGYDNQGWGNYYGGYGGYGGGGGGYGSGYEGYGYGSGGYDYYGGYGGYGGYGSGYWGGYDNSGGWGGSYGGQDQGGQQSGYGKTQKPRGASNSYKPY